MARDCGCSSHPMLQGINQAGEGLSRRRVLLGAGVAAGALALGPRAWAGPEDAPGKGGGGRVNPSTKGKNKSKWVR